jgi:hypothetical protein
VDDNKDFVPRPIHLADVLVVKVKKIWEDFANDLEKIEEDQDGA